MTPGPGNTVQRSLQRLAPSNFRAEEPALVRAPRARFESWLLQAGTAGGSLRKPNLDPLPIQHRPSPRALPLPQFSQTRPSSSKATSHLGAYFPPGVPGSQTLSSAPS